MEIEIAQGFDDAERPVLAALYWEAFGPKLARVMGPDHKALAFLAPVLCPRHALVARMQGQIVGVAGFKTPEGAFVGGGRRDLARAYGPVRGALRGLALSLLERDVDNARFLMDGICVAPEARGRGVGTLLLDAIAAEARARGYGAIRLDVIDTNRRARSLYEREGFRAVGVDHMGLLRHVFGFTSATTMVRNLQPAR